MIDYSPTELQEALRAIDSIIHKCEKAQEKFPEGNAHHTLLRNRLKAMYISKTLLSQELAARPQRVVVVDDSSVTQFLLNLEQLHTTALGADRIKSNLHLGAVDVITWCKEKIQCPNSRITRKGKNWYVAVDGYELTVNAHSYTVITAHRTDNKRKETET